MIDFLIKFNITKNKIISTLGSLSRIEKFLLALITIFALFGTGVSIYEHETGLSVHFDMVTMYQPTYNSYIGIKTGDYSRIFEMTEPHADEDGRRVSRAAYHFDIILIPISLLLFIYESPNVLFVLQAFSLCFSAWFVYLFAKKVFDEDKNKEVVGAICAVLYLFYYPMHSAMIRAFHPVTLGTFFLFGMIYFLYTQRYKISLVFFLIALTTKESVAFTTFMYGLLAIYYFYKKDHRFSKGVKIGILITMISIIYAYFINILVIPHFAAKTTIGVNRYALVYYELGSSQKEILITSITKPQNVVQLLRQSDPFRYIGLTNIQTLFGVALGFPYALATLPEYLINILSLQKAQMTSIGGHYESILMVSLYVSIIIGFYNLKKLLGEKVLKMWLVGALFVTITSCRFSLYFKIGNLVLDYARPTPEQVARITKLKSAVRKSQIPIAGTRHITPLLVATRDIHRINHYKKAALVVVKREDLAKLDIADTSYMIESYNELTKDPNYQLIETVGDLEIYERK